MIKAILVDDEKGAIETLSGMLNMFCSNVQVIGKAYSVIEARVLIKELSPDLVFLDVNMPFENGFDLLQSLDDYNFHVIFTTAYNNYALKAIKFGALDYLLKPIDFKELEKAVAKINKVGLNKSQYKIFKAHQLDDKEEQIVLPHKSGFKIVNYSEILRLEGDRNYTKIYFINGEQLLVAKTLKEYEELLSDYGFFRVHQSNIVNMNCIRGYISGRGGKIQLIDNSEVDLARSRKKTFLKLLESF